MEALLKAGRTRIVMNEEPLVKLEMCVRPDLEKSSTSGSWCDG